MKSSTGDTITFDTSETNRPFRTHYNVANSRFRFQGNIADYFEINLDGTQVVFNTASVTGIAVNDNLFPNIDSNEDLGSSTKFWKDFYTDNIVGPTTFNTAQADVDFIFSGDNSSELLFLNADLDRVHINPTGTRASSASVALDSVLLDGATITITGSTNITKTIGFNFITVLEPTYTSVSALTIDIGATLYISDAPFASGSTTLTTGYALWIDNGNVRFDNSIYIGEQADADADLAGLGQLWVDNLSPNVLKFTDDAGTDFIVAVNTTSSLSSLDTVGTITTGSWQGTVIDHERGGIETDISAITTGGLLRGASSGVISILAVGTDGLVLTAQADGSVDWESVAGSGDVTGDSASADKEFVRFNSTTGKVIESPVTDLATTTATLSDNADITFYDAVNDGNPVFSYGSSATNDLAITVSYGSGAQTVEFVEFKTTSSSATADFGEYRFNVDEALIATIDDGGIELADAKAYFVDTSEVLSETALGSTVVSSSLTSVGTLTALTVDDVAINGKVITMTGSASDLITLTAGTNGTLVIQTVDDAAAAANLTFTIDGTIDIDSTGVLTLDSGAAINIEPADGSAILLDGTISIDGGVITAVTTLDATGDITAANFQPDGDTASSDAAAVGFTSTEGLILTGQGSVTDVTIKNDADATVLGIPTGTSTVELGVDGTVSSLVLTEKASIALDPAGGADGDYSGITITGIAGATVAFGEMVFLQASDSRWELTDADAVGTAGTILVGICVLAAAADASVITVLLQGTIRADAAFPTLTVGAPAYIGTTPGAIQVAAPTGVDDVVRVAGFALTANELYFNPEGGHITHTG